MEGGVYWRAVFIGGGVNWRRGGGALNGGRRLLQSGVYQRAGVY